LALQQESNRQLIQQRLNRFRIPVIVIFLIFAARLWQLQIIQGIEYSERADRNRIRPVTLVAPRGAILDRNNIPLVENRPSFSVLLYRESMKDRDATVRFLTEKLGVDPDDLQRQFQRNRSGGLYRPFVVKEDAGMEDISIIEAHRRDHPEIQLAPEPRRLYHHGNLASHLLGYLGEITEDELSADSFTGVTSGTRIGRSGIERVYNHYLLGMDGERQVMVDSRGREVGLFGETDAVTGKEILLTLDLELQLVAEKALEGSVGAVVAMDPRNGEILVMASSPSFDPNFFSGRISGSAWNELISRPYQPMQNRAIQNSYAPGSIFKVILAIAALEEGIIRANETITCRGSAVYYGRSFSCWHKSGHGPLNVEQAIAKSCNVFFYEIGRRMGITKIAEFSQALGLGESTGIDLPGERNGLMPSPEWKRTQGSRWYPGETISVAIGQGAVSVTPLQVVRAVSAIATGGLLPTPHVLMHAEKNNYDPVRHPVSRIPMDEEHVRRIRDGMWASVNARGTGQNAMVPGMDICGKTGTVQVVGRETRKQLQGGEAEDHAWFTGFAGRDNPEIAVAVFVEHGGKGGAAAAPIARELFQAFNQKKKSMLTADTSDSENDN
jgi:penicillin-binding protein 2